MASHAMTSAERMCLHSAARDLHTEFHGIFGQETIESLLFDLDDPAGKTLEEIRPIRDEIRDRVTNRLEKLASM